MQTSGRDDSEAFLCSSLIARSRVSLVLFLEKVSEDLS